MLKTIWKFVNGRSFRGRITEYLQLTKSMFVNDTMENISSEKCKREREGDVEEPNKKLCTDAVNVDVKKNARQFKYAMLLAYNGGNYYGMQCNKDFKTIELQLFKAFNKVGIMQENEMLEPYRIKFQRAARTDKSVSAARQIVSLIMRQGVCKLEDINAHLPSDIRVFAFTRATKNFSSKGNCDARTYSYLLPTFIFSQEPLNNFLESDYRITQDVINKINEILNIFVGSHNFHNYTSKLSHADPRARRYIMTFTSSEPFVKNKEFMILTVKGQSFILHQIRKMVGALIAVMRGIGTADTIKSSLGSERIRIPLAPGEGLFLERVHFNKYNKRYGKDGFHKTLEWEENEEEILNFRQEKIINPIINTELSDQLMIQWVSLLMDKRDDCFLPFESYDNQTQAENKGNDEEGQDDTEDDEMVRGMMQKNIPFI